MDAGWRRSPWITDKRPSRHARTRPQCPVHGHSARTVARAGAAVRRPEQRPDDDMIWCLIVGGSVDGDRRPCTPVTGSSARST
ncbi:hypothetical protein DAI22_08g163950 [Oryza sativa Japonica Group]|nr:hypothetical protein DAI22_08g163950 [Oryza sativa Japonica Group]